MQRKLLTSLFLLTPFLCFGGYSAHALVREGNSGQPSTPPQAESYDTVAEYNVHGGLQGKIASHGVNNGLFVSGSFLYYEATMDNLEYANNSVLNTEEFSSRTIGIKSKLKEPDFEWHPGGRAEIGYTFARREQWKPSLLGTHLTSRAKDSIRVTEDIHQEQLAPIWYPNLMGQLLSSASAKWKLNFTTLDLILGRDFFISRWISVQPFVGLRGSLDQSSI